MSDNPPQHWLRRTARHVLWILAAGLPIVTAIFIAGPDAIRNFPKVPGAIQETASSFMYDIWLDKQLTRVWDNQNLRDERREPQDLITIELWVKDGSVDGTIGAPTYVGKWRPKEMPRSLPSYPTALLRGKIETNALKVEVYDFLNGKTVYFADLIISLGEEDLGELIADPPDSDIRVLRVETGWQISPSLPQSFILTRTHR